MKTSRIFGVVLTVAAGVVLSMGARASAVQEQPSPDTKPLFMTMRLPMAGVKGRVDQMALVPEGEWPKEAGGTARRGMGGASGRLFVAATAEGTLEGLGLNLDEFYIKMRGLVEPQGVVWAGDVRRLAVSCGDGTVKLYEPVMGLETYTEEGRALPPEPTLKETASLRLAGEAEDMVYDEAAAGGGRLYVAHGRGIAVIDPKAGEKGDLGAKLDGHAEDLVLGEVGGKTRLFACVARAGKDEKGEPRVPHVAVVDPVTMEVVERWGLGEVEGDGGGGGVVVRECFAAAFDEAHGRLFVACRNPAVMVVLDVASGKRVASLPCAPGADGVAYDARGGYVFVTGGEMGGKISVFKQTSADAYELVNTVDTLAGASTCMFDEGSRRLLVIAPGLGGGEQPQATLLHYEVR